MELLLFPILAAVTQACSLIFHKVGLTRRRIELKVYLPLLFSFLSVYSLATLPVLGWVNWGVADSKHYGLLTLIIGSSVIWNYLYFYAIKSQKVNAVENVINVGPIMAIGLSWLLVPASFDVKLAAAASVGTLILLWGYWEHKKFTLNKVTGLLFISVFLASLESVLIAELLQDLVISPALLFSLRVISNAVVFWAVYKPQVSLVKSGTKLFIALNALLSIVMMLLRFYALKEVGVVYTSLVLILVPILVYTGSSLFLHERLSTKQKLAATSILLVIIYATALKVW